MHFRRAGYIVGPALPWDRLNGGPAQPWERLFGGTCSTVGPAIWWNLLYRGNGYMMGPALPWKRLYGGTCSTVGLVLPVLYGNGCTVEPAGQVGGVYDEVGSAADGYGLVVLVVRLGRRAAVILVWIDSM